MAKSKALPKPLPRKLKARLSRATASLEGVDDLLMKMTVRFVSDMQRSRRQPASN
jgi:hypothetical protein